MSEKQYDNKTGNLNQINTHNKVSQDEEEQSSTEVYTKETHSSSCFVSGIRNTRTHSLDGKSPEDMKNKLMEIGKEGSTSLNTIVDVFIRDLKRVFVNPVAVIVLLGIIVLPCLYSWYSVWASWNPYGNTKNVQIAVVNKDKAYEIPSVGSLCVGDLLESNLEQNDTINWQFVDEEEAMDGVNSNYYFAALIIPENFTASFGSIIAGEGRNNAPEIDYYINGKYNSMAVKVSETASSTVENKINQTFVGAVAKIVSGKILEAAKGINQGAEDSKDNLIEKLGSAKGFVGELRTALQGANGSLQNAQDTIQSTKEVLVSLGGLSDDLTKALSQTKTILSSIHSNVNELIDYYQKQGSYLMVAILREVATELETVSSSVDRVYDTVTSLVPTINSTQALLDQLSGSLVQLSDSNSSTDVVLSHIQTNLDTISERISELYSSSDSGLLGILLSMNPDSISKFMKNPVQMETEKMYPVENYGSGVAPFYTNLALWVGGIVLVSILRVEVNRKGLKNQKITPKEAYLGRGMLFSVIALIQGAVCSIGNIVIGIQCLFPVAYVLTSMLLSLVYVQIIYFLASSFKHMGKALAMILVVLQIPGSSGMFPIEMMPRIIQLIHPLLPFTYGIAAVRETLFGFYHIHYVLDIAIVLVFLLTVVTLGLFLKPKLSNLVLLFDRELRKTDFMSCETNDHFEKKNRHFQDFIHALLKSDVYREEALKNAALFETTYEKRKKHGLIGLICGPLVFLIVSAIVFSFVEVGINFKIFLIFLWIIVLIITVANLIFLEYSHQRLSAVLDDMGETILHDSEGGSSNHPLHKGPAYLKYYSSNSSVEGGVR